MSRDIRASRPQSVFRLRRIPRSRRHSDGDSPFPRVGLLALAAAIFVSMSTEFLPGGLLPDIAEAFDRPVTDAGQLVTVFAAAVIVTTTPLAILTRQAPRKPLALIALTGIAAATGFAALSPTFELLLAARVAGGIAHGLFWSVAAAYAADLVPSSQLGRATAITAAGGAVAGILGAPLGNALCQLFGWRAAFGVFAIVAVGVAVLVATLLPPVKLARRAPNSAGSRPVSSQAGLSGILLVCLIILLVVIGQTTYGTYGVVWLTDVAGLPEPSIPIFMLVTGIAAFVAVSLIGRPADRWPNAALVVAIVMLAALMALFPLMAEWGTLPLVAVALVQSMGFAVAPILLQTRMMRIAPHERRSTAAALQTTAFNIAIGGGAVVGGLVIGAWGLAVLPWAAALLSAVGISVLLLSLPRVPRAATSSPPSPIAKEDAYVP